jgi:hypothetical protein
MISLTVTTMLASFKAARRVSAPVLVIKTADQWAAVQVIVRSFNGNQPPMLSWDLARGILALNDVGQSAFSELNVDPITTTNPGEALGIALRLPERAILFAYNFHRVIGNEMVAQGVWNVREQFKRDGRTLILLGPDMPLPAELAQDAFVIDEPLPTETQLREIIVEQIDAANLTAATELVLAKATDAVSGLAAFPAEQVVAMSLTPDGLDIAALWERKRQVIEQTPGLSVYRGSDSFADIGGVANAKSFGQSVLGGQSAPRAVVFIDEIEKAMSGSAGDTSGVSQEMLGTLLTWMQEKAVTGMLLVGPPGAAKSAYAKALGNTGGIPTIMFDLSGMKGSLVGESGRNLRTALKVVDAVSQGRALIVATCNSVGTLPPELRRRFTFGTFFFDLPTAEERASIWSIYLKKFGLQNKLSGPTPKDESWTGAEIRMCCDIAWRLGVTLVAAANYIVPVAKSAAESIQRLREQASGRFISASEPGPYQHNPITTLAKANAAMPTRRYSSGKES